MPRLVFERTDEPVQIRCAGPRRFWTMCGSPKVFTYPLLNAHAGVKEEGIRHLPI